MSRSPRILIAIDENSGLYEAKEFIKDSPREAYDYRATEWMEEFGVTSAEAAQLIKMSKSRGMPTE